MNAQPDSASAAIPNVLASRYASTAMVDLWSPRRKIVLRADSAVPYVKVREMMHLCREIGFPGVSLRVNTRPTEGAQASAGHAPSGTLVASHGN